MVKGLKMEEPPDALLPLEGGTLEARVLSSVGSPALMVSKWVAKLFDLQVQAGRIRAEQVSAVQAEVGALMDVYHKTRAMQLAPMPASLSSFTYFFVFVWVYTACPVIAVKELHGASAARNTAPRRPPPLRTLARRATASRGLAATATHARSTAPAELA